MAESGETCKKVIRREKNNNFDVKIERGRKLTNNGMNVAV
jgi:hypothetical protein